MRGMNTVLPRLRVRDGGVGQANFRLHSWFVVQSLRCVQHFATPWTAARQPSLSFTISQSLLKLMSIESVIPVCLPLNIQVPLTESYLKFPLRSFLMGKCFQVLHVYPFFCFRSADPSVVGTLDATVHETKIPLLMELIF